MLPNGLLTPADLAEPRRYGFHATLRAPFKLAEGAHVDDLLQHARQFACDNAAVDIGILRPQMMGRFIALCCRDRSTELMDLAGRCVSSFETCQAPLSSRDRERRLSATLSERQLKNLDDWGYPYVFDEFVFHMTLTGRLDPGKGARALASLKAAFAEISTPTRIDALSILEQPARDQSFRILERFALAAER
jgi:2'-5' RNA ligase